MAHRLAFLCSFRAAAGWAEGQGHDRAVVCGQRVGARFGPGAGSLLTGLLGLLNHEELLVEFESCEQL